MCASYFDNKKLESALPAKHIARLEKIQEMSTPLVKASKKTDLDKGIFDTVQSALLDQNILKVEYKPRKSNRALPFEVHPYSLLLYKGEFYILCFAPGKGMRYFAMEGIKKAERIKGRLKSVPPSVRRRQHLYLERQTRKKLSPL
jgi:predicted DNA-binding transcriptional regulator YafY